MKRIPMERRESISIAAKERTKLAQAEMLLLEENETYEKAKYSVCWFLDIARVGLDEPDTAHLIACVAKLIESEREEIAATIEVRAAQWSDINAYQPVTAAHTCTLLAGDVRSGK